MHTKKKPKEYLMSKITEVPYMKYLANNHSGEVTSPSKVYNLAREGNIALQKERGILPNSSDLANIIRVAGITSTKDLERRKAMGDNSTDLLGIARKVEICPDINIYLHGRSILNYVGELSASGRLVLGVDGTGNLINFPNTPIDGTIQHIFLNIQTSECLLSYEDSMSKTMKFTPATVSERISNRNRASDITKWLKEVSTDTVTAMASVSGNDYAYGLKPVMVKMDCALELMNGCIGAFRESTQVSTAAGYNGCVTVIILRYEAQVVGASLDEIRRCSIDAYRKILCVSPCIFKQCKSHIHRAIVAWPKTNKDKKPIALRLWKNQFEGIFQYVAELISSHENLSDLIARVAVVISVFSSETIPCGQVHRNSDTNEHHPRWVSQSITTNMDEIIKDEAAKLRIGTEVEETELLESIFSDEDISSFDGKMYTQRVVDRMMGKGEEKSMMFAVTYLTAVTAKKGTINCLYVLSPYKRNEENEEIVAPKFISGVTVDVSLPHKSNVVRNPLYCPEAAEYVMDFWMNRIGLACQASVSLADIALDANVFASNQSLEGHIRWEKHGVSSVTNDMSSVANLIHRRYDDMVGVGRLLSNQIDKATGGILSPKASKCDTNNGDIVGVNPDAEESEMQWKRTAGQARIHLQHYRNKMLSALELGKDNGNFEYEKNNIASMWRVLEAYATNKGMSFMGVQTFRTWVSMTRSKVLKREWSDVIDNFYEEYV